ncbi:hypothetical protein Pla108_25430 [Botrimarina colliarenosi]|uniref:Uncharacterized protein n=1 Tax=Botrimarina colliarenosi TaxID=2528001 RepID=A0A5C6AB18_9BACT|nr:hypothetical protein [Botrimarina colliarenosi]TWT96769.1 hypothetical protein Pla108_25430 [Botrimarina colliarenosi]
MTEVSAETPPVGASDADSSSEAVQEFVRSAGQTLRVDAVRGVLRGVKLLGLRSLNGRRYEEPALRKAIGLYEGSKVNVNHPTRDPLAPRDYRDRLGVVRNVRLQAGTGLYGDLHYNPSHPLAEQLAWDAEHAPENVGLSHNVLARTRREGSDVVIEAITRVQSVDLVADPATTSGLFEQQETPEAEATLAAVRGEIEELQEQLKQACEQALRESRWRRVEQHLREHNVSAASSKSLLNEAFARRLLEADEADLDALIREEVRTAESRKPRSREQPSFVTREQGPDTKSFVESITRRR